MVTKEIKEQCRNILLRTKEKILTERMKSPPKNESMLGVLVPTRSDTST
ncbi:hypothetical protein [Photobacterium damselae]